MRAPRTLPFILQVLLWGAGNTLAGAAVGLAVGALQRGFQPTIVLISVLFGNVVGFTVLLTSTLLPPRLRLRRTGSKGRDSLTPPASRD